MSLSAVFKYMAKQAVDYRNMTRVKVWHTHTTVWLLKNYSQRILMYCTRILLLDLTYGRTMRDGNTCKRLSISLLKAKFHYAIWSQTGSKLVTDLQRSEMWPII